MLVAGRNYGWPVVSYGRTYPGPWVTEVPWRASMEQPLIFWVPSIAASGIAFYTGDRFPAWKGNVFVGGMRTGEIDRTGRVERIVFNGRGDEMRRESLLTELRNGSATFDRDPTGCSTSSPKTKWSRTPAKARCCASSRHRSRSRIIHDSLPDT